jgi:succinate dehydrogenase/fumarate reductase-like Fe-S protein
MSGKTIHVRVFRFDPSRDGENDHSDYIVPFEKGMSAMDALDYIYQHLDGTIAYYDHAGCSLGICARCTGRVNGRSVLLCQAAVEGDIVIEPVNAEKVLRDLVPQRGK